MEKRRTRRVPRRVPVRVRRHGEPEAHVAYTVNLSSKGAFLAGIQTLQPGERVQVEFQAGERSFVLEAEVVRVRRVPLALRQHDPGGVAVRLLSPEELVGNLLGEKRGGPNEVTEKGSPLSAAAGSPEPAERAATPSLTLEVRYPDRTAFLAAYRRDLSLGRLMLPTREPLGVGQEVGLRLSVGEGRPKTTVLPARVLQLQPPPAGSTVAAVWLELFEAAKERLEAFVAEVRQLP